VPPYEQDRIVGRALRHPVTRDDALTFEVLEESLPTRGPELAEAGAGHGG